MGSFQSSHCRRQGQSMRAPAGNSRHLVPKGFTSRQVLLWGLTPGESGDLLRPSFRRCGDGTQAGCFTASHGLCQAHRHTCGDTHIHTDKCHVQSWTRHCLKHKRGLRPRVVIRHLVPPVPSPWTLAVPLKKPQPPRPTPPTSSTENKQVLPS